MSTDAPGNIRFLWYGSKGQSASSQFKKGWIGLRNTVYFADAPKSISHKPYYETDMTLNQTDLECHSFELSTNGNIPEAIQTFIKNNRFIDFPKGSRINPDIQQ